MNGEETEVDCGGSTCPGCLVGQTCAGPGDCASNVCDLHLPGDGMKGTLKCVSCSDGVRNGRETDVDCGGSDCAPCETGAGCCDSSDCASAVCVGITGLFCGQLLPRQTAERGVTGEPT